MKCIGICAWIMLTVLPISSFASCRGNWVNPITDVCWSCIFPITIGALTVYDGVDEVNPGTVPHTLCMCGSPIPKFGISLGFWEPVRLVDVVREPYCFVGLGGTKMDLGFKAARGGQAYDDASTRMSHYQVHWYDYPVFSLLNLMSFAACSETADFDLVMLSEFDPSWDDDQLNLILFPEAALFASPVAQAACAGDCMAASSGKLSIDPLHWCAGCQGSMYPLSGTVGNQISAVQGSTLLAQRMTYRLHRTGLLWGTMNISGLCGKYPMPIMNKSQYKTQMTYPVTAFNRGKSLACNPYGRTSLLWESGKSFPIKGEDFGYLIWRKRNCCAL